uniref:Uncharacterized protein n=1 Tax=Tetradesmus obliquus TaxID=3088 RepID=A0A383WJV9_TETOB|eukprot:jgi/Sobl393_1/10393/SZX77750.1
MLAQQHRTRAVVTHAVPSEQQQQLDPQQNPWSSSSSSSSNSSSGSSQQQHRDRPDMGRRANRRVKIPLPKRPNQSSTSSQAAAAAAAASEPSTAADFAAAAEAAAAGIDPEAPGFKERALMMGLLEAMDSNTRGQFEQYMSKQLQQVEQEQQQAAAVDFLQAAMDKAADKALNHGEGAAGQTPGQVFETEEGNAVMWQALREQFNAAEVALLDDVLGADWASFSARAMQPETVARIAALDMQQQALLIDVLSKISGMTGQMDAFEAKLELDPQAPSSSSSTDGTGSSSSTDGMGSSGGSSSSSSSSSGSSSSSQSSWGSSFRKRRSARVGSKGRKAAAEAQQYWDTLMDDKMTAKVQRMLELTGQAARGQLQYGQPPSRHFRALTHEPPAGSSSSSSSSSSSRGGVSLRKLQRLGQFLRAAANLEPFQNLLAVLSEKQPHLASPEMLWLSNLGGDDWFVKPELQGQAYAAAQAAAEAFAMQEAGASSSSSSSSSSAAAAVSAALLPYVDEQRIAALAAVEPDTLWFMAELAAADFDEDVLLKWSLHPTVGQRLMSGAWLSELALPEELKALYAQAQVPEFMAALNFDIQQQQ